MPTSETFAGIPIQLPSVRAEFSAPPATKYAAARDHCPAPGRSTAPESTSARRSHTHAVFAPIRCRAPGWRRIVLPERRHRRQPTFLAPRRRLRHREDHRAISKAFAEHTAIIMAHLVCVLCGLAEDSRPRDAAVAQQRAKSLDLLHPVPRRPAHGHRTTPRPQGRLYGRRTIRPIPDRTPSARVRDRRTLASSSISSHT